MLLAEDDERRFTRTDAERHVYLLGEGGGRLGCCLSVANIDQGATLESCLDDDEEGYSGNLPPRMEEKYVFWTLLSHSLYDELRIDMSATTITSVYFTMNYETITDEDGDVARTCPKSLSKRNETTAMVVVTRKEDISSMQSIRKETTDDTLLLVS